MKCKKLRSSERCKSFGSGLEAARKGRQKGPAGPEKEKGRKPEGKGPDVLLMANHETGHCRKFRPRVVTGWKRWVEARRDRETLHRKHKCLGKCLGILYWPLTIAVPLGKWHVGLREGHHLFRPSFTRRFNLAWVLGSPCRVWGGILGWWGTMSSPFENGV